MQPETTKKIDELKCAILRINKSINKKIAFGGQVYEVLPYWKDKLQNERAGVVRDIVTAVSSEDISEQKEVFNWIMANCK